MHLPGILILVLGQLLLGCATIEVPVCESCDNQLEPANARDDEDLLHFRMLQVSAGLVPKEHASGRNRVEMRQHVTSRHSALQWLVQQAETKFLPFAAAVLLPHALAFLAAHFIMSRRSGQAVEVLHEKKEAPKSLSYIIERAGPMWLIHMLGIFSFATGAPSVEYLYLNYFARQSHPDIDCATQMAAAPCAESVMKCLKLQIIRGFALPLVQFIVGPALGALSDAFGRKPAILVIRSCLLISTTGTIAVAWFSVPIWIDFCLGFFTMIPWGAVPFAWYMDRMDHAPSIVYAVSLIEGSCIVCAAMGTALGTVLSSKMAILVEFLGRVVTLCIAVFFLPESLPAEKRMPFCWSSLMPTAAFQVLFQSPLVEKLSAISIINSFHWAGYYTMFGRFLQSSMAWTRLNSYQGGLAEHISQVLWLSLGVSFLLRAFGQTGLMVFSTCACVTSNIVQMLSSRPWHIYLSSMVLSGPSFIGNAVVAGIVGAAVPGKTQGMLQSALALVTQVAGALGPVAFATVYQLLDPTAPSAPSWTMYLYILYGALFAVPSLALTLSLRRNIERKAPGSAAEVSDAK
ncbi:unnamed protein product [Durusdinium trenchii]|uniref:Uncharacterized protein n=2 Tax=Durusdinium trenchii TaxID=1381693 RepID=A0ABP0NER6_9DINO